MTPPPSDSKPEPGDARETSSAAVTRGSIDDGPVLREHAYDGITEFDQKLPNWWLWSWYIFIAMFIVWWLVEYQFGLLASNRDVIEEDMAEIKKAKAEELAAVMAELNDETFWERSRMVDTVAAGREVYNGKCISCHGADLSAKLGSTTLPGLPLNDAEWKYGGKPMEIFKIVSQGSPDVTKGMIAWEPQVGGRKVAQVVAFILSHHEPPPAIPKDPE